LSPFMSCCNSTYSSTSFDSKSNGVYSSATCWKIILMSKFEYEITIIRNSSVVVEVEVVFLRKLKVAFNSSFNSLLFYSCSKF
jgi:hypothetical protein